MLIDICSGGDATRFENNVYSIPPQTTLPIVSAQLFSLLLMAFTQEEAIVLLEQFLLAWREDLYEEHFPDNFQTLEWWWEFHLNVRATLIFFEQFPSFAYVLQSTSVADVFLRFATLQFITRLDNYAFVVCQKVFFFSRKNYGKMQTKSESPNNIRRNIGINGKTLRAKWSRHHNLFGGGATDRGKRDCQFLVDQYVIGNHDGLCAANNILPIINEINQANLKDCENRGGTKRTSIFGVHSNPIQLLVRAAAY